MRRRAALAAGLLGCLLIAVLLLLPFARRERQFFGTLPQPQPTTAQWLLELSGGARACLDEAALDERSELAQFRVGTYGRASQPLRLTVTGEGYRADVPIRPSEYADNELLTVEVPPAEDAVEVTICLTNEGRRRVGVYGSADRTKTRSTTEVDGARQPGNFSIWFVERGTSDFIDRTGTVIERVQAFRPPFLADWMLWALLALVVVGTPVGMVAALDRALRDDDDAADADADERPR